MRGASEGSCRALAVQTMQRLQSNPRAESLALRESWAAEGNSGASQKIQQLVQQLLGVVLTALDQATRVFRLEQ